MKCDVLTIGGGSLNGSSHERGEDVPVVVSLESTEFNLVGTTFTFVVKNYTTGVAQTLLTKNDGDFEVESQVPSGVTKSVILETASFSTLPMNADVTLEYSVTIVTAEDGLTRVPARGKFTSKQTPP